MNQEKKKRQTGFLAKERQEIQLILIGRISMQ